MNTCADSLPPSLMNSEQSWLACLASLLNEFTFPGDDTAFQIKGQPVDIVVGKAIGYPHCHLDSGIDFT